MSEQPIKVMVVEDEVLIGMMIARKLQALGYQVGTVVTTGEEAVARARQELPDVVLMDVTLAGEMSGLEAARQIKAGQAIPIIIYSGYDDTLFYQQVRDLEPVAVLKKLGPMDDITAAIDQAAGRTMNNRRQES